eukprot:1828128-Rhodomonas_salina.1
MYHAAARELHAQFPLKRTSSAPWLTWTIFPSTIPTRTTRRCALSSPAVTNECGVVAFASSECALAASVNGK